MGQVIDDEADRRLARLAEPVPGEREADRADVDRDEAPEAAREEMVDERG